MANIVLINPRFDVSYWGMEYALPLLWKRCAMPAASLPLLAALSSAQHRVTIIDENVEPLDYRRIAQADIVGLTGMNVQRLRMRQILAELKRRGAFTVVGGPWVTVQEDYFGPLADVVFIGEAEESWPRFLREWEQGHHQPRYEQSQPTDLSQVPLPRYDLLRMRHYVFGSLQLSRGCPFQCEFCDIIVTFGRRPRFKTVPQILRELEALKARGMKIVFIVDDNLIGNKNGVKPLLEEIGAWQQARGFPFIFVAEASLDLAEDPHLMRLMVEANIISVFIGIESPNEDSLRETKKFQNLRPARSLLERVYAVQDAGLEVWCGMIVGFDHDDASIFQWQREFLRQAGIAQAMVGMLSAIPKTPLYHRLRAEGRLDLEDSPAYGTNVIPLQMTREELRDGYVQLMWDIYQPDAYFERVDGFMERSRFQFGPRQARYWKEHPWSGLRAQAYFRAGEAFLYSRLMQRIPDASLRAAYRSRFARVRATNSNPAMRFGYLLKCAMHYHHYTIAQQMAARTLAIVNSY
ncbi:MAG TPA: B12-binding domain-containing radical SAM protein [Terriglobia bacterium]|nr:B12-binding domain-containing radical SAM protein [Terriglobia bacterium]